MTFMPAWFRKVVKKNGDFIFGCEPKIHRIPFGPLKGQKIFTRFSFSPRMYFGVDEPWVAKLIQEYVKPGDVIEARPTAVSQQLVNKSLESAAIRQVPDWISFQKDAYRAQIMRVPTRDDIQPIVNEQLIVEFYSR